MQNLISNKDYVKHYGIKGMKWGFRRKSTQTTNNDQSPKKRMSNKELHSRVRRLRLEQEFEKLTTKPSTQSRIEKIVKTAGTVAAVTGSALTIYKNVNEISKIINKTT